MDLASALFGFRFGQRIDLEQRILVVALDEPMVQIVQAHRRLSIHVIFANSIFFEFLATLILKHWLHFNDVLGFKLVQEE